MLEELPVISITATAHYDDVHVLIPLSNRQTNEWTDLPAGKDMTLIFSLTRENKSGKDMKAFAPKFPKVINSIA